MKKFQIESIGNEILELENLLNNKDLTQDEIKSIEYKIEYIIMHIPLNDMIEIDNYIMSKKINLQS